MGNSSQLGNATCNLLAKEGCVAALIKQCNAVQQKCQDVRVLALRGLSSICCVAECIREFEKVIFIQTFRGCSYITSADQHIFRLLDPMYSSLFIPIRHHFFLNS